MASGLSVSNVKLASIANNNNVTFGSQTGNFSSGKISNSAKQSILSERLEELLVLELRKDGGREYLRLSVRGLYKRVLSAITSPFHQEQRTDKERSPTKIEAEEKQVTFTPSTKKHDGNHFPDLNKEAEAMHSQEVSIRERLGSYLHPRDMRRLVTPFSASNEPDVIVRRHVILLNYDPLRAIIVRDRLLVIVPEGTDSLLINLEQRVRGGVSEIENSIFGTGSDYDSSENLNNLSTRSVSSMDKESRPSTVETLLKKGRDMKESLASSIAPRGQSNHPPSATVKESFQDDIDSVGTHETYENASEWDEMQGRDWVDLPFELQCVDACLHIVTELLSKETVEIQEATASYIADLLHGENYFSRSEDPLLAIRHIKDAVSEMKGRINSFVFSMNRILDDDEYMALCNLQRLSKFELN